ncbi:MAG TPA: M20 family metallo-hydrolase [bacterium]
MIDKTVLGKLSKRIDSYQDEIIEIQTHLTASPALAPENGGDGELKKAEYLQSYFKNRLNCDATLYQAADSRVSCGYRPNLVARLKGKSSLPTLWIMSHMDVVPPGDLSAWQGDPWKVRVENGKIFGRGVEDNQQGIVSSLIAAKAFHDEGIQPARDFGLVFAADEETGNRYGMQYLLEKHSDIFKKEDLIIIPDSGVADGSVIEVAEKSILWLKFRVVGKTTHASTPERGVNAFKAAANLIVKMNNLYLIYNIIDPMFDPPTSTFEPTKREANVPNVNTIPGEDVFYFDCRILPSYDIDRFLENVKRLCQEVESRHQATVEMNCELDGRAAPPTPIDAPIVKALESAISDIRRVKPKVMGIGGGTVAAFFRKAGFNAAVWATQDETLHEPNEYVRIQNIIDDAKVFAHTALQD